MTHHRKSSGRFPETRWSLVGRAGASDDQIRQMALQELLTAYLPGLRDFLTRSRQISEDLADDLLQEFIADKILMAKLVRSADRNRGKFRSFLVKSLKNFVTTRLEKQRANRPAQLGSEPLQDPEWDLDRFEQEWVQQVVRDALCRMEADCRGRNRADLWEIFRLRVVDPMLNGVPCADYGQIVRRFDIQTPRQAMNLLANAKRCFLRHLRDVIRRYVADESEIDAEIEDLRRIVGR